MAAVQQWRASLLESLCRKVHDEYAVQALSEALLAESLVADKHASPLGVASLLVDLVE
jgi:hypothetical protein